MVAFGKTLNKVKCPKCGHEWKGSAPFLGFRIFAKCPKCGLRRQVVEFVKE